MGELFPASQASLDFPGIDIKYKDINEFSPYSVNGKCFFIALFVSQWHGPREALVNNNSIYIDFPEISSSNRLTAIIQGEDPYVYTAVSGAELTVPRAVILMDVDKIISDHGL